MSEQVPWTSHVLGPGPVPQNPSGYSTMVENGTETPSEPDETRASNRGPGMVPKWGGGRRKDP